MDAHPRYTLVGVLVTLILFLLVLWVTWLWKAGGREKATFYQINFRQQSLAGLQVDGLITMKGIRVGTVKSIKINEDDVESVNVVAALFNDTPVKTDTKAVISRNLLTGLASIDLQGSSQAAKTLLSIHRGSGLPEILEGQGGVDRFYQSAPNLVAKIESSLERLDILLSDQNIQAFSSALVNIEKGSRGLEKIDPLLDDMQHGLTDMRFVMKEVRGNVGPLLTEMQLVLREVRSAVKTFSENFSSVAKSLTLAGQSLKEPRSSVLGLPSGQLGPGEYEQRAK